MANVSQQNHKVQRRQYEALEKAKTQKVAKRSKANRIGSEQICKCHRNKVDKAVRRRQKLTISRYRSWYRRWYRTWQKKYIRRRAKPAKKATILTVQDALNAIDTVSNRPLKHTWRDRYLLGRARGFLASPRRLNMPCTTDHQADFHINTFSWLESCHVNISIASILLALHSAPAPHSKSFSYATGPAFQSWLHRKDSSGHQYGIDSNTMIIPLIINRSSLTPADTDTSELTNQESNHHILAVARKDPINRSVAITYYDSSPSPSPSPTIQDSHQLHTAASNIMTTSHWLPPPSPSSDFSIHHHTANVAHQVRGSNACGIHTILNAWAVMLGIDPAVPAGTEERGFKGAYVQAIELFNLACQGKLNLGTVRAFLFSYGFCEGGNGDRNADGEGDGDSGKVQSVFVNERVLEEYLDEQLLP